MSNLFKLGLILILSIFSNHAFSKVIPIEAVKSDSKNLYFFKYQKKISKWWMSEIFRHVNQLEDRLYGEAKKEIDAKKANYDNKYRNGPIPLRWDKPINNTTRVVNLYTGLSKARTQCHGTIDKIKGCLKRYFHSIKSKKYIQINVSIYVKVNLEQYGRIGENINIIESQRYEPRPIKLNLPNRKK